MDIETRIKGIPALVRVHHARHLAPNLNADNDIDYYGGWDLEYTVCDRNGRPAAWLENKMNTNDIHALEAQIMEAMGHTEPV